MLMQSFVSVTRLREAKGKCHIVSHGNRNHLSLPTMTPTGACIPVSLQDRFRGLVG